MPPQGKSIAWDHFVDVGQYQATCKICKRKISYKSSVSNLVKHLQRKHPLINLVNRNEKESENVRTLGPAEEPAALLSATKAAEPSSSATSSAVLQLSSSPAASSLSVAATFASRTITSYINKKNSDKCKIDIDNHIMDLFISDFQPFRIVEDRGFRKLINFAFPFYTIPSRKYFANNLLPSRYESLRTEKIKEIENNAQSICITTDVWTSRVNDSIMAITGHYIDKSFVLKSNLLECVLLEESHTAENLAYEIKRVTDEWKITPKILLAVSDNAANMKKALEQVLHWRHFGCYAHTLNLAVQSSLESSQDVLDVINKVKSIVTFFKRSNLAWEKLKKFQENNDKNPKRPLQDISTRWNSTYYMLKRIVEIKEEINSSLSNLDSKLVALNHSEWELCENLCFILKPCEEVTKEVSAEKYLTGSLVIPITTGLMKTLQNLDVQSFSLTAIEFKDKLLGQIVERFSNLEGSRTFAICMFLDPRFKLYFENPRVAESTKKHIIELVTSLINSEEQPIETASCSTSEQPQSKLSSVWQHYTETMKNIQPKGTSTSRAIVEVQRYLEDTVVLLTDKVSPLDWWRENQNIYPHLSQIAMTKLNALATSVPCERIFSAGGLILSERRTRLGTRKLQQLMFLHQNY